MHRIIGRWLALMIMLGLHSMTAVAAIEAIWKSPATLSGNTVKLRIIGSTDLAVMVPIIKRFQSRHGNVSIYYAQASTVDCYQEVISQSAAPYDLVISSSMDLQVKLVNDGYAQHHRSATTRQLPDFMRWRDQVFGFTDEPISIIYNKEKLQLDVLPDTRFALVEYLRGNAAMFMGRIQTYDINQSGAGYLFATQDSLRSDTFWRLMEVFGALDTRLSCCSSNMIEAVRSGEALLAYNVVGSYIKDIAQSDPNIGILPMQDYNLTMTRTALIPGNARNVQAAGVFIDSLISDLTHSNGIFGRSSPITLGPGLLVFQDRMKRSTFLEEWNSAIFQ